MRSHTTVRFSFIEEHIHVYSNIAYIAYSLSKDKVKPVLTLKAPITIADDKFCDIFPDF